jgi:hypothetical protein
MSAFRVDWRARGFSRDPVCRISPSAGLVLYRCWGARSASAGSSEWGTGYFSVEKPSSVLDAELRFNVVDWNNGLHFVSTFLLPGGFDYWLGPVLHGAADTHLPGTQVFVEQPLKSKLVLIRSTEVLRQNVSVSSRDGNA